MKAFCRALVICAVFLVAGVGGATPAPWRQTSFLIGGYGINDPVRDPRHLVLFNDAGLDFVHALDYSLDFGRVRALTARFDSLRRARPDFRLQVIYHYSDPRGGAERFTANPEAPAHWSAIATLLRDRGGARSASTLGWSLWDEPCDRATLASATALARRMRSDPLTSAGIPYINLLSLAGPGESSCLDAAFGAGNRRRTWEAYLDAYLGAFDRDPWPAPVLSFDDYPFLRDGTVRPSYFEAMTIARDRAAAHSRPGARVPVWVVVQLVPFRPPGKPMMKGPNMAQVRWQAWCAVAYGAWGISYWTTGSPHPAVESEFGKGIVDPAARPTALYAPLKQLNRELHALGPTLLELEPISVLLAARGSQRGVEDQVVGDSRSRDGIVRTVEPGEGSGDCLIGHFRRAATGEDYLLVMNRSLDRVRSFGIRLVASADAIERISRVTGKEVPHARNTAELRVSALAPATAELFRILRQAR